ncbi:MAG: hypothetical protein WDW38_000813 [Sanguina aurantia]
MTEPEDIPAGDVILVVPLRCALTDHPDDEESHHLMYEGAPWSVRLAAKLLRQSAAGPSSAWSHYLAVLPAQIPTPVTTYSWDQIKAITYPPAANALHSAGALVADAFSHSSEESLGGDCDQERLAWAMSVVHSRTFGSAARKGGVGVRMLVPLVDMLNHGGDEAQQHLSGAVVATDNVRWDLRGPGVSGEGGGWRMEVSATRDVREGAELLLSYGERPNDDFFIHYGFVPRANPHDEVVVFEDLEEALDWHYQQFDSQVLSGSRVSEPLLVAFASVAQSRTAVSVSEAVQVDVPPSEDDVREAETAVALRCSEMLQALQPPVTWDLAVLAADAATAGGKEGWTWFSQLLLRYHQHYLSTPSPPQATVLSASAESVHMVDSGDSSGSSRSGSSSSSTGSGSGRQAGGPGSEVADSQGDSISGGMGGSAEIYY